MASDAMVTSRVPFATKEEANEVLANIGMTSSQVINRIWGFLARHKSEPEIVKAALDALDEQGERLAAERERRADALASVVLTEERLASLLGSDADGIDFAPVPAEDAERWREEEMLAKYFGPGWLEASHA